MNGISLKGIYALISAISYGLAFETPGQSSALIVAQFIALLDPNIVNLSDYNAPVRPSRSRSIY